MIKTSPRVGFIPMLLVYINENIDMSDRHDYRVELNNYHEIKENLEKQKVLLKTYELQDKDMIDYVYKDGLYIGSEYIFCNDNNYNICGKITIVFEFSLVFDEQKKIVGEPICAWYIFRTWVSFRGTFDEYNKYCNDVIKSSKELQLKLVRNIIEHGGYGTPKDPFLEPIFYEKIEKFDIDSFKDFMKKIEKISDIKVRTLYCPADIRIDLYV